MASMAMLGWLESGHLTHAQGRAGERGGGGQAALWCRLSHRIRTKKYVLSQSALLCPLLVCLAMSPALLLWIRVLLCLRVCFHCCTEGGKVFFLLVAVQVCGCCLLWRVLISLLPLPTISHLCSLHGNKLYGRM